jgi:hypothetical protein
MWQMLLAYLARHLIEAAYKKGKDQTDSERMQAINSWLHQSLNDLIGKPVIAITGQYDDPLIGFVVGVTLFTEDKIPYPVISNYVTLQSQAVFGRIWPWSQELQDTLFKLSPEERWTLFNSADSISKLSMPLNETVKEQPSLSQQEIMAKLEDNGFYHLAQLHTA